MTLVSQHDALLLDLDGTLWEGGDAIEHAVQALDRARLPMVFVTNNASKSPALVAEQLRAIDISAQPDDVLTSAQAAVMLAAQDFAPGAKVLVVGTDSFKELTREAGFEVVDSADDRPDVVLHGHNPETGWRQLSEAALSIRAGARYIASNVDSTLPMQRGLFVGNGSMVAAVTNATGVIPESAGKPQPAMFRLAAKQLGSQRPLAVGDRLDTDIAGGIAAGVDTLQVVTGVSGHRDVIRAPREQRATYVGADMRALFDEPERLLPCPQGEFVAERSDADIVLKGGHAHATAMHALRTVLSVAWESDESFEGSVIADGDIASRAMGEWR